jgi:DNA-binding LacI/PurR family transcriptional regulator
MRTTIKDIARVLGINASTVSRALKDHQDISLATRNEVKRVANELHYHPNLMAINLRNRRSRLVGLIIPEITLFFFPSVIQGIEDVLHQNGYNLLMLQSSDLLQREIENVHLCTENGVEGLLLSVSRQTITTEHLNELHTLGVPIILFDKVIEKTDFIQIIIDDAAAASQAVLHLQERGSTEIIGIFGNPNLSITQKRVEGFRRALLQQGLLIRPDAILFAENTREAQELVQNSMASSNPPNGIFAMSDEILAGVLPALRQKNIEIPKKCKLISISDGNLPNYLDPLVTYLHHSGYEIGATAAKRLCECIAVNQSVNASLPLPKLHILPVTLVQQQST